jgi:GNAT superfamily N-acetyltransferase
VNHQLLAEAFEVCRKDLEERVGAPLYFSQLDDYEWTVHTREDRVAEFRLRQFPNCSALALFYSSEVYEKYRHRGIATVLTLMRMAACKNSGYTGAICTVRRDNKFEQRILRRLGWKRHGKIVSRHGGFLSTWMVNL